MDQGTRDFILQLSKEGREWFQLFLPHLVPVLTAFLAGWHVKQPGYMRLRKDPKL